MTIYAIGLGSNLGDRLANLRAGLAGLRSLGEVSAVSAVYGTEPVGGPAQGPYLNAVAILETSLDPSRLLDELAAIEARSGRVREVRWGPRTLDLDILASDGPQVGTKRLQVPHPRVGEREFALRPLTEVWPEAPVAPGITAEAAMERIGSQGVARLASSWEAESPPVWGKALVVAQVGLLVATALAMAWDGSLPAGGLDPARVAGLGLAVGGAALALAASLRLGPGLSPVPEPREGVDLVETGPYSLVRHPIYGGVTMLVLGAALTLGSLAGSMLAVGLGIFFYLKSEYEERRLLLRYPGYHAYRERVRRRLIPYLV